MKAAFLATSLEGPAVNVLGGMDSSTRQSYSALVAALETRFGEAGQQELNRVQLRARRKKRTQRRQHSPPVMVCGSSRYAVWIVHCSSDLRAPDGACTTQTTLDNMLGVSRRCPHTRQDISRQYAQSSGGAESIAWCFPQAQSQEVQSVPATSEVPRARCQRQRRGYRSREDSCR